MSCVDISFAGNKMAALPFFVLACVLCWGIGQGGFDCHRPGSECQNGGRCEADGHCTCANSWGLNCMYSSSEFAEGDVSCRAELGCMSKTCLTAQSGQPTVCVCDDGRTGPRCEQDRFQFKCFVDRIAFNIVPYGNFTGYIYRLSLSNYNSAQCRVGLVKETANDTDPSWEGYGGWELFSNDDGICRTTMTKDYLDKLMSQRVYFLVQYSPMGLGDYDEIVEFKCDFHPVQFREYTADLETQRLDPSVLPLEARTGESENFEYKLLNEEMRPLPSESVVNVGDILFFQISLTETSGLTDMIVKRCALLDSDNREEAKYFTNLLDPSGCALPPIGISVNKQSKSVTLGFRVIRYTFSPVLYIRCQVSGCVPSDVERCRQSCGSQRRKRTASEKKADFTHPNSRSYQITSQIRVLERDQEAQQDIITWKSDFDLCMETADARIILTFTLVTLTSLTTALCVCLVKKVCFSKKELL